MDILRVGRISSVNYPAGTARVLYADRDNAVSDELPMLANDVYYPLKVDDFVWVLHLPYGSSSGLILGRAWSDVNVPPEGADGVYRQDFSREVGDAYIKYDASSNTLRIKCTGNLAIEVDGNITVTADKVITITAEEQLSATAPAGDVVVNGISLTEHTHPGDSGGTTGGPS